MSSFALLGSDSNSLIMTAELSLKGFDVRLFELEKLRSNIEPIVKEGGVEIEGAAGKGKGRFEATILSRDVLGEAEVVIVPRPTAEYLQALGSNVSEGQIVVIAGGYFHALNFVTNIAGKELLTKIVVSETSMTPYAGIRKESPTRFMVKASKEAILMATYPASQTTTVLRKLRQAFRELEPAQNVLETSLNNLNPMFHPPILLMSTSTVEKKGATMFLYKDGVSKSVTRVVQLLDEERLKLVSSLGFKPISSKDWLLKMYGTDEQTLHETMVGCRAYETSRAPDKMTTYLDQDIPYGLVPIESIGRRLGLEMPSTRTMIDLASMVTNRDYRHQGYSATKLGLKATTPKELLDLASGTTK